MPPPRSRFKQRLSCRSQCVRICVAGHRYCAPADVRLPWQEASCAIPFGGRTEYERQEARPYRSVQSVRPDAAVIAAAKQRRAISPSNCSQAANTLPCAMIAAPSSGAGTNIHRAQHTRLRIRKQKVSLSSEKIGRCCLACQDGTFPGVGRTGERRAGCCRVRCVRSSHQCSASSTEARAAW
jgi:hypothetical protein